MSRDTAIALVAITVPFIVFAIALAWADYQTRRTS
jgi:hypothetical protein